MKYEDSIVYRKKEIWYFQKHMFCIVHVKTEVAIDIFEFRRTNMWHFKDIEIAFIYIPDISKQTPEGSSFGIF